MEAVVADQTLTAIVCDTYRGQAEVGCQECQKRLCPKCRHIHDQFAGASFHSLTALGQDLSQEKKPASSKRSMGQRGVACQTHARDVTVYCRQCDEAVCSQCHASSHRGHAIEKLTRRMDELREEVRGLLQTARSEVEAGDRVILQKNQQLQEVTRQEDDMVRQTVEDAGKVRAWANGAENHAVSQINAISAPIKTRMNQQKNAALERKTALSQLTDRARLTAPSGSFKELKSLREEMEASLSVKPCSFSSKPETGGGEPTEVFRRCSSGKDVLQTTVSKFVGEVTPIDADTPLQNESAWGFECHTYLGGFQSCLIYTTVNGLVVGGQSSYLFSDVSEFRPGSNAPIMKQIDLPVAIGNTTATSLPSSDILFISYDLSDVFVGPDDSNLVRVSFPGRYTGQLVLSHDSLPNGRNAHVCYQKNPGVFEIQELVFNPPADIITRPVFQIVCKRDSICSFDVSSDAKYFAVLDMVTFSEYESEYLQTQVSVFERLKAEPCAVFRSPKTVTDSNSGIEVGDVCFSPYNGKEMLRVAVSQDDTVYTLDFRHNCAIVGRTPFQQPLHVRTDAAGRIWVVGSNHVVAFNSAQ
ncbi:hypothetical protein ACOMHN_066963 [Nucella lapillus]